jgi:hypothetical protein
MAEKMTIFLETLERTVERLEHARSNILLSRDTGSLDSGDLDMNPDYADNLEAVDAVTLVYERVIDELAQVLDEEIENLRRIVDDLAESP